MRSEKSKTEAYSASIPEAKVGDTLKTGGPLKAENASRALAPLLDAAARDRRMHIYYALTTLLVGLGFFGAELYRLANGLPSQMIYRGFTVMGLAMTALLAWKAWSLRDPFRTPFFRVLLESPGDILWFYELRSNNFFGTLPFLRIHLRDGDSHQLAVASAGRGECMSLIANRSPAAMQGFSKENELTYTKILSGETELKTDGEVKDPE